MASVTLNVADRHAPGVVVGAYPRSSWAAWQLPPSGAAVGAATATGVVAANGAVTITGLADNTAYYAARSTGVGGYLLFSTDRLLVAAGAGGPGGVGVFQANHAYQAGALIIQAGATVYALVDFTSTSVYDVADWGALTAIDPTSSAALAAKADLVAGKVPAGQLPSGVVQVAVVPFYIPGDLAVGAGKGRYRMPTAGVIQQAWATLRVGPDTQPAIFDVNKNATTIFTTQANRPSIAAAGNDSALKVPDVTALASGDILTVDVDQIGVLASAVPPVFVSDTVDATISSGTSFGVTKPTTSTGDFWLISLRHNSATLNTPAGLTLLDTVGSGSNRIARFWRLIDGSEGTYTFTSSTAFVTTIPRHIVYRGVDQTTPVDQNALLDGTTAAVTAVVPTPGVDSPATGGATTAPAALTTALTNAVLIYTVTLAASRGAAVPTGYTSRASFAGTAGAASLRHLADKVITAAGSYGADTFNLNNTGSANHWWIGRLILKGPPAPGGAFLKGTDGQVFIRYLEA